MSLFSNLFKRNTQNEVVAPDTYQENNALAAIFGKINLDDTATALSAFFAAVQLISNSVAQLPIVVKTNDEVNTAHPINSIFKNTLMSKYVFMKQMINDLLIHGNAYAYIERAQDGTPINLIYCQNGDCTPHFNKNTQELWYRVFCVRGKVEPVNVIHLYKDSFDGWQGRSIISFAQNVLKLGLATDKSASRYYSSGCSIQGALTIKGTRKNSKEQARQAFIETHSGANASGLVILDDDMSYTPLSSNANESQMLEARLFNVQEIARYFNISPVLLGDLSKTSYSTIEQANIEFVLHTLMPYIVMIEDEFNRKLVKPSEKNVTVDLDESALLRGDKKTTSAYLKELTSAGIISLNEARRILGLPEKEGCDELIIPYTDTTQNTVGNKEEEPDEDTNEEPDE